MTAYTEFLQLVTRWREDTRYLSNPTIIINHPAYQEIINLGPVAIPWILVDLKETHDLWFMALRKLVSDPPTFTPEQSQSYRAVVQV